MNKLYNLVIRYFIPAVIIIISSGTANVTPAQTKFRSLNYMYYISGKYTLAGQQGSGHMNSVASTAGRYPAMWGEDFSFVVDGFFGGGNITESRRRMVQEAKQRWDRGEIINLTFHACPPTQAEPCGWDGGVLSGLTNEQWQDLITPGTTLYNNWISRLDKIAVGLQDLENYGAEVFFRPFHEMNQGAFWWGGRPGPNGTARLYKITHDYLTKTKGLTNIIWVWNIQDFSTLASDVNTYDPGSEYWDMVTLDIYYSDGTGITPTKYNIIKNKAGNKPFAIGELDVLPDPVLLESQPEWTYFIAWRELTLQKNSPAFVSKVYNADNVITRDELPGWQNFCPYDGTPYSLPGIIEAENFNTCEEGNSYQDSDTLNSGGQYRTDTGVDIQVCSEGGYNLTDTKTGEWLTYSVSVDSPGTYSLSVRVASAASGKSFHVEMNGINISGSINVPNTGGEQQWDTVTVNAGNLSAGLKVMRIVMDTDSININNVKFNIDNKSPTIKITAPSTSQIFNAPADITITADANDEDGSISKVEFYNGITKIGESTISPYSITWTGVEGGTYSVYAIATDNAGLTTKSPAQTIIVKKPQGPYSEEPYPVPGLIEMENYDIGDEGLAYHDLSAGNKFGVYRQDNVDVESCTDTTAGFSLGDFQTGEWVEYSLNVSKADKYDIEIRVATQSTAAKISVIIGAKNVTGNLSVSNTGGWQKWQSIVIKNIQLAEGNIIMRVTSLTEFANINFIRFTPSIVDGVEDEMTQPGEFYVYQNYPNPFNPGTILKYQIPERSQVSIKIFDMLGREVSSLVNEEKDAGYYEVMFDGSSLSSGVYFYTVSAGRYSETKRMLLLK